MQLLCKLILMGDKYLTMVLMCGRRLHFLNLDYSLSRLILAPSF